MGKKAHRLLENLAKREGRAIRHKKAPRGSELASLALKTRQSKTAPHLTNVPTPLLHSALVPRREKANCVLKRKRTKYRKRSIDVALKNR